MGERSEKSNVSPGFLRGGLTVLMDAAVAVLVSAAIAVCVNFARAQGIPLIAAEPYDILVPCPEPGGEVSGIAPTDPALRVERTFFVDARSPQAFKAWRFRNAINVTFDYLDPTPKQQIEALARAIAKSKANKVVVYGDGEVPDTGEQLGKEISGHGIKNVYFLKGGAKALQSRAPSRREP